MTTAERPGPPPDDLPDAFEELQRDRLLAAWRADLPGSTVPRVMIGLPSYSLDRSLYEHYGERVQPLENRYLYLMIRARDPATKVVYLSSLPVRPEIVEGYLELVEPARRDGVLERSAVVSPEDVSARPLAEKLLDRGDLIDAIRAFAGGAPVLIEPWNVTEAEAALAVAIGAPLHGTHPRHRVLATKSNGRRLLRSAGVPVPEGTEDVRSPADVARAVVALRARRPGIRAVVVKLDDSVAGDGNVVLPLSALPVDRSGAGVASRETEAAVDRLLPDWYKAVLAGGGIVEERVEGDDFRSPSAQATITPSREVEVLATHEQRLGGPDHQVYEGCSFPADPAYATVLGEHAARVGEKLAQAGAVGRFAVDFVAFRGESGAWEVYGLEINLRKGGTTHPFGVTRLLTGGRYDPARGTFFSRTGRATYYAATDNLVDAGWVGRPPREVRAVVAGAGLAFDRASQTGVVTHLLDCLRVDGRMGYTAIGHSPAAAEDLEHRLVAALRA